MEARSEISASGGGSGNIARNHSYLYSPSHIYFGMIGDDGKFVVYKGAGPEDKHDKLWATSVGDPGEKGSGMISLSFMGNNAKDYPVYARVVAEKGGRYYDLWDSPEFNIGRTDRTIAKIEDDGNFCIYKVDSSGVNTTKLWASNVTDPIVEYEMSKIDYKLDAVQYILQEPLALHTSSEIDNELGASPAKSTVSFD